MNSERLIVGGVIAVFVYWLLSSALPDSVLTQISRGDDIESYECSDVVKVAKDVELQNALGARFPILYIEKVNLVSRDKKKIVCHGNVRTSYSEDRMALIVRKLDDGQVFVEVKEIDSSEKLEHRSKEVYLDSKNSSDSNGKQVTNVPKEIQGKASSFFDSEKWSVGMIDDFNEDGVPDYVIKTLDSHWCGSGGCFHLAFVSTQGSFETVELGQIHGIERNNNLFVVHAHGSACGKLGYEACSFEIFWDGGGFKRR